LQLTCSLAVRAAAQHRAGIWRRAGELDALDARECRLGLARVSAAIVEASGAAIDFLSDGDDVVAIAVGIDLPLFQYSQAILRDRIGSAALKGYFSRSIPRTVPSVL
jgi:hypothetical protein